MKRIFLLSMLFLTTAVYISAQNAEIPEAPEEYRRPKGYNPVEHRFKYSLNDLRNMHSEKMMQDAEKEYNRVIDTNSKGKWKPSGASIDQHDALPISAINFNDTVVFLLRVLHHFFGMYIPQIIQ